MQEINKKDLSYDCFLAKMRAEIVRLDATIKYLTGALHVNGLFGPTLRADIRLYVQVSNSNPSHVLREKAEVQQ